MVSAGPSGVVLDRRNERVSFVAPHVKAPMVSKHPGPPPAPPSTKHSGPPPSSVPIVVPPPAQIPISSPPNVGKGADAEGWLQPNQELQAKASIAAKSVPPNATLGGSHALGLTGSISKASAPLSSTAKVASSTTLGCDSKDDNDNIRPSDEDNLVTSEEAISVSTAKGGAAPFARSLGPSPMPVGKAVPPPSGPPPFQTVSKFPSGACPVQGFGEVLADHVAEIRPKQPTAPASHPPKSANAPVALELQPLSGVLDPLIESTMKKVMEASRLQITPETPLKRARVEPSDEIASSKCAPGLRPAVPKAPAGRDAGVQLLLGPEPVEVPAMPVRAEVKDGDGDMTWKGQWSNAFAVLHEQGLEERAGEYAEALLALRQKISDLHRAQLVIRVTKEHLLCTAYREAIQAHLQSMVVMSSEGVPQHIIDSALQIAEAVDEAGAPEAEESQRRSKWDQQAPLVPSGNKWDPQIALPNADVPVLAQQQFQAGVGSDQAGIAADFPPAPPSAAGVGRLVPPPPLGLPTPLVLGSLSLPASLGPGGPRIVPPPGHASAGDPVSKTAPVLPP